MMVIGGCCGCAYIHCRGNGGWWLRADGGSLLANARHAGPAKGNHSPLGASPAFGQLVDGACQIKSRARRPGSRPEW
ncbi:hypothetical protein C4J83_1014 [Pseudomonas sp. LBUM920]|nr:hypothetical protein C4J83_1014 [Pseudomonas sp. LBUM920]